MLNRATHPAREMRVSKMAQDSASLSPSRGGVGQGDTWCKGCGTGAATSSPAHGVQSGGPAPQSTLRRSRDHDLFTYPSHSYYPDPCFLQEKVQLTSKSAMFFPSKKLSRSMSPLLMMGLLSLDCPSPAGKQLGSVSGADRRWRPQGTRGAAGQGLGGGVPETMGTHR